MRITINLASRPFADIGPALKKIRIAMAVLAVCAIALGLGRHHLHKKAEAERARASTVDTSIARVNQERQGYQAMMTEPQNAAVLAQAEALNKLIDVKAFSWTLAMEDLENVLPGGVQVTTLEPTVDKKTGQITVRLRVIGPRDKAVELVANLEHSRRFLQPRIIGESAESNNTPGAAMEPVSASNRVNFDLLADYNPATPAERKAANKRAEAAAGERAPAETTTPRGPGPGLRRPPYTGSASPAQARSHAKRNSKPNPGAAQ